MLGEIKEGRGAYDGPDAFRKKLGSLSFHESSKIDIYDFGNICVDDGDLEKGQAALADLLFTLREKGFTPFCYWWWSG